MSEYVSICEQAARIGGQVLLDWQNRFDVREKGPADLVTQADLESQQKIKNFLLDTYPTHGFLGEEENTDIRPEAEFVWIVDPLDGTTNYVHGLANYSTSVALRGGKTVIAGAVFDPIAEECYSASLGEGAQLNGSQIQTSEITKMSEALLAVSLPAKVRPGALEIQNMLDVMYQCQAIRRMGSAALNLCYLAAGRLDGYWASSTKAWDIAAGALLVGESGGKITSLEGGTLDVMKGSFIAAANPTLHRELISLLGGASPDSPE